MDTICWNSIEFEEFSLAFKNLKESKVVRLVTKSGAMCLKTQSFIECYDEVFASNLLRDFGFLAPKLKIVARNSTEGTRIEKITKLRGQREAFLVSEYIKGRTLGDFSPEQFCDIFGEGNGSNADGSSVLSLNKNGKEILNTFGRLMVHFYNSC